MASRPNIMAPRSAVVSPDLQTNGRQFVLFEVRVDALWDLRGEGSIVARKTLGSGLFCSSNAEIRLLKGHHRRAAE